MVSRSWIFVGSLLCVVYACSNSARLTCNHLRGSGPWVVRAATVRILFMVPLYSVESWLALVCGATEFNNVLSVLRKGYECLLVLAFMELLLAWLGGLENLILGLERHCCHHLPPCSLLLPPWTPPRFVRRMLIGVLQYVPCSLLATSTFIVSWCLVSRAPRTLRRLQVASMVCMNASQACAVYCLIAFYHANRAQLGPFRPIQKMLSVKFIFFLAFWQEMAVRTAEFSGVFDAWPRRPRDGETIWPASQVAGALLNCLICVEMLVLSVLHPYVWPPGESSDLDKGHEHPHLAHPTFGDELPIDGAGLVATGRRWWQVCLRFLAAFDLSADIPSFVGSVYGLSRPGAGLRLHGLTPSADEGAEDLLDPKLGTKAASTALAPLTGRGRVSCSSTSDSVRPRMMLV